MRCRVRVAIRRAASTGSGRGGGHGRGERTQPQRSVNGACGPPRFASGTLGGVSRLGQSPSQRRGVGAAAGPRAAGTHPSPSAGRVAWQTQPWDGPRSIPGAGSFEEAVRRHGGVCWTTGVQNCTCHFSCRACRHGTPGAALSSFTHLWVAGSSVAAGIAAWAHQPFREPPPSDAAEGLTTTAGCDGVDCRALHRFGRPFRP
jgi:hypothetical protein